MLISVCSVTQKVTDGDVDYFKSLQLHASTDKHSTTLGTYKHSTTLGTYRNASQVLALHIQEDVADIITICKMIDRVTTNSPKARYATQC